MFVRDLKIQNDRDLYMTKIRFPSGFLPQSLSFLGLKIINSLLCIHLQLMCEFACLYITCHVTFGPDIFDAGYETCTQKTHLKQTNNNQNIYLGPSYSSLLYFFSGKYRQLLNSSFMKFKCFKQR